MMDKIEKACGVAVNDNRFLIVGCEHVEGFEAVANGDKVDTVTVQPGIVQLAKEIIAQNPSTCLSHFCGKVISFVELVV